MSGTAHMLKTGKRGNPFCKVRQREDVRRVIAQDTHDLFATLVVSLELKTNTKLFQKYPNTFTTDDACANLASLRFSQSNRHPDPNDPSRIVTTTTTTTFSMGRDIAKGICQHFLDARLIENSIDRDQTIFKDRGIYGLTPKGLHVLQLFVNKNGIGSEALQAVRSLYPLTSRTQVFDAGKTLLRLVPLERRVNDDDIEVTRRSLDQVWKRFAGGKHPNYVLHPIDANAALNARDAKSFSEVTLRPSFDRAAGVEVQDVIEKIAPAHSGVGTPNKSGLTLLRHVFGATHAVEWLIDHCALICREEAAEVAAHFVRFGLMRIAIDKTKQGDKVAVVEARADPRHPGQGGAASAEFKWGGKVFYTFTEEGRRLAETGEAGGVAATNQGARSSDVTSAEDDASSAKSGIKGNSGISRANNASPAMDTQLSRQLADLFLQEGSDWSKDASSHAKLRAVIDDRYLQHLFKEFLRSTYSEENLEFYLAVDAFKKRFTTTSSASGAGPTKSQLKIGKSSAGGGASSAMEAHQAAVVAAALHIYSEFLAPMSPRELNIDHQLRAEVVSFIQKAQLENGVSNGPIQRTNSNTSTPNSETPPADPQSQIVLRATQVQVLLRHYERIQDHIFRLLATDQPKFSRSGKFLDAIAKAQGSETSSTTKISDSNSVQSAKTSS